MPYLNAILIIIVIIIFPITYHIVSILPVSSNETEASNQSKICIIKSLSSHLEYFIPSNKTVKLDDLIEGKYYIQGTDIKLNLSRDYYFKCSPSEYIVASINPQILDDIIVRKIRLTSVIINVEGNYTLDEIDIDGISFHSNDIYYLNNSLVLLERNSMIVPFQNNTLALSLIKNGAHLKIGINNITIDLVIYPLVKNHERAISITYTENRATETDESPSQWSGSSSLNSNMLPNKRDYNRRIFYTITLIVSVIILLYYLETVRKLD